MVCFFLFFKQKTAYEMRISDWSSDVCSSDLKLPNGRRGEDGGCRQQAHGRMSRQSLQHFGEEVPGRLVVRPVMAEDAAGLGCIGCPAALGGEVGRQQRSEEHTSELQSLMRISYAVFCLKKKTQNTLPATKDNKSYNYIHKQ